MNGPWIMNAITIYAHHIKRGKEDIWGVLSSDLPISYCCHKLN